MTKTERLEQEIISRSSSKKVKEAFLEWELIFVYQGLSNCLCGQKHIKNICLIENKLTNITVIVGSSCVEKFFGLPTEALFKDLKKLKENLTSLDHTVKEFTVKFAYKANLISDWELEFYRSILTWTKLSEKQKNRRFFINQKIVKLLKDFDQNKESYKQAQEGCLK